MGWLAIIMALLPLLEALLKLFEKAKARGNIPANVQQKLARVTALCGSIVHHGNRLGVSAAMAEDSDDAADDS